MPRKKTSKKEPKSDDEPREKKIKVSHVSVEDEDLAESKESCSTPKNWPAAYENMKTMMEGVVAPLESMPWYQARDPEQTKPEERFRILVALMLSSQTKDEQTLKVWDNLCKEGLSIDWVIEKSNSELSDMIKSVNFRSKKATYIQKTATILKEKYNGDTPDNLKELTALPGVGNKMAFLFLQSCYGNCDGLGVDVHLQRLANRLGWVKKNSKDADKIRVELESWVPKEMIFEFNRLIPRFGQMKCTANNPICDECLNNKICPSAGKC